MVEIDEALESVDSFLNEVQTWWMPLTNGYTPDSIFARALSAEPTLNTGLNNARSQSHALLESAFDHAQGVLKSFTDSGNPMTAGTNARAVLEAAAVGKWLSDPSIGGRERVARSYARRYEELLEQEKFLNLLPLSNEEHSKAELIPHITNEAKQLGFDVLWDKKRNQIGLGTRNPGTIGMIDAQLGMLADYRLLSSFTHSHQWAAISLAYDKRKVDDAITKARKHVFPETVNYMCWVTIAALGQLCLSLLILFGGDPQVVIPALEKRWTALSHATWHTPFWRAPKTLG